MSMERPVRIGLLRLADAAPIIVASERGMLAQQGLAVSLSVEPSWANIADKLAYGLLDAAVILPPLAMAASLGLRGARADLIVPMGLSQGGNTITLSLEAARTLPGGDAGIMEQGRAFAVLAQAMQARGVRPRLGIVHLFSGHNLLLRYWLAACDVDPDRDLDLVVIPPADMMDALAQGRIDGFCAGAPWGTLAEQLQVGRVIAPGSSIWNRHPEKVLAVRRSWAETDPDRLDALIRGLVEAARFCEDPHHANDLAHLLAEQRHIGAPVAAILPSLVTPVGTDGVTADRIGFFDNAATMPWTSQAAWFAAQMNRWGWLAAEDMAAATALYRPDLYRSALAGQAILVPEASSKPEGARAVAWSLSAGTGEIPMLADRFCDGLVF